MANNGAGRMHLGRDMASSKQEDITMKNVAGERQRVTREFQKALKIYWLKRVKKACEDIEALMMEGKTR